MKRILVLCCAFLSWASSAYAAQNFFQVAKDAPQGFPPPAELRAVKVEAEPEIDGRGNDPVWSAARPITVRVNGGSGEIPVTLRAVQTDKRIFFLVEWLDPTEDRTHKPWIWSRQAQSYTEGKALEDALIFRFETGCSWVSELDAGFDNESDVWIWRAGRTDPVGYADDMWFTLAEVSLWRGNHREAKRLPVSSTSPRWRLRVNKDGSLVYSLEQPWPEIWYHHDRDLGTPSFRRKEAPPNYAGDVVLQFYPSIPTKGAADVKAKGSWKDGRWTVEVGRSLKAQVDGSWQDVDFTWRNGITLMSVGILNRQEGVYDYAEGPGPSTSGLILFRLADLDGSWPTARGN